PLDAAPNWARYGSLQENAGIPPLHDPRGEGAAGVRREGGNLHPVSALCHRLRLRPPLGKGVRGHRHQRGGLDLVPGPGPVLSGGLRQQPRGLFEHAEYDDRADAGRQRWQWWWRRRLFRRWWRRGWRGSLG